MRTKILTKIFISYLLILTLINLIIIPKSNALSLSSIMDSGKSFLDKGDPVQTTINESELRKTSSNIYNVLLIIGIIIAFGVGIILGIQWMLASVEDKAKIKEMLIPYIVGCVVLFGGFSIWKMVVDFGQETDGDMAKDAQMSQTAYTTKQGVSDAKNFIEDIESDTNHDIEQKKETIKDEMDVIVEKKKKSKSDEEKTYYAGYYAELLNWYNKKNNTSYK